MATLDPEDAPNTLKGVQSSIDQIRSAIHTLDNGRYKEAKQALRRLGSQIQVLQHSLDHPDRYLHQVQIDSTRGFLRKAKISFQKHSVRFGTKDRKKSKPAARAVPKPTRNTRNTEIIDLTGGTSDEEVRRPDSEADGGPLWFFDSSAAPVTVSCQPDETYNEPRQSCNVALQSKEGGIEGRGLLQASAAGQERSNMTTSVTPIFELHKVGMSSCDALHNNVQGGATNEVDALEDLQTPSGKHENCNFSQKASLDDMLEAAMNSRDHDLWYDPTVDFDEGLLP